MADGHHSGRRWRHHLLLAGARCSRSADLRNSHNLRIDAVRGRGYRYVIPFTCSARKGIFMALAGDQATESFDVVCPRRPPTTDCGYNAPAPPIPFAEHQSATAGDAASVVGAFSDNILLDRVALETRYVHFSLSLAVGRR